MILKKGIQNAVNTAVNTLTENSKKVTCSDDIARVATISAADEVIGNLISEAMDKVTADGVITVQNSRNLLRSSRRYDVRPWLCNSLHGNRYR